METPKCVNVKYFYSLFLAFISVGCATTLLPVTRDGGATTSTFSFKEYLDKGFEFSIYPPAGNYSVVGIINTTIEPRIIEVPYNQVGQNGLLMVGDSTNMIIYDLKIVSIDGIPHKYAVEKYLSSDTLLNVLYKEAVKLGANGISDFHWNYETLNTAGLEYEVLKARGIAIKTE